MGHQIAFEWACWRTVCWAHWLGFSATVSIILWTAPSSCPMRAAGSI